MATQEETTQRITDFIGRIHAATEKGGNSLKMLLLSELSYIHNRKKPNGEKFSTLVNRKLITEYRAALTAEFGAESEILKSFRYSPERVDTYNDHRAAGREEKHRNQRPIDPDDFVESALLSLGHAVRFRWSTPIVISAVCALTGRRPYEVTVTGTFEPDPDDRRRVLFSGQAKTRDENRAIESYSIPVLADRELVIEAVAMLRGKVDTGMDNKTFSQRYAKEIGIASKRAFKDANGMEIKPRDLREAYAAVAYYQFANRQISEVQFLNDILGHKSETLDTTLYYLGFYIDA